MKWLSTIMSNHFLRSLDLHAGAAVDRHRAHVAGQESAVKVCERTGVRLVSEDVDGSTT